MQRLKLTQVKNPARFGAVILFLTLAGSTTLQAAELSLLSGLYQSEKSQYDGDDNGGKSTISAGGRFGEALDQHVHWFGQGVLTLRSYDAPKGGKAPASSTSLALGGGVRYYFGALSERLYPFVAALGEFRNEKDADFESGGNFTESEANGLYYSGLVGMRMTLDSTFFLDFETSLFRSALFATETSKDTVCTAATTTTAAGCSQTPDTETRRTDLYVDTVSPFSNLVLSLGMKI